MMYALILVTAVLVGEVQGSETTTCLYEYEGRTYTYIIPVTSYCPMSIDVNY